MIANIYMHYVLLWWFKEKIQPLLKGFSGAVVYADDFVMSFQYKSDAELVYELLKKRMKHFGLSLEEKKKGFTFFQLNTNGIRLAQEAGYARKLKKAGLKYSISSSLTVSQMMCIRHCADAL